MKSSPSDWGVWRATIGWSSILADGAAEAICLLATSDFKYFQMGRLDLANIFDLSIWMWLVWCISAVASLVSWKVCTLPQLQLLEVLLHRGVVMFWVLLRSSCWSFWYFWCCCLYRCGVAADDAGDDWQLVALEPTLRFVRCPSTRLVSNFSCLILKGVLKLHEIALFE